VQVFPNIPAPGGENIGFSECARKHLAVRPRKGDAVLFHSIAPHGALEKKSLHAACPVIKVSWRQRLCTAGKRVSVSLIPALMFDLMA
jgi:ectoine hydroxylase-related dioxygenase (phytanoyl-CoA dioxygenase family)